MNMKYKKVFLAALILAAAALGGCANQPDTVEDPLSAFGIDAVLPFATVAPDVVEATPTPAPTTNPDDLVTDPTYGQAWKQDNTVDEGDDWLDEDDEPTVTPRPTARPTQAPAADDEPLYERLSYGDSGTAVKNLQRRLKNLGYYSGSVDGQYGTGTVAAVKLYQSVAGLSQSGVATASLQEEIFSSYAPEYEPTPAPRPTATPTPTAQYVQLSKGDSGSRVTRLQNRLKTLGYYTGTVDGEYGSGTVSAVKRFQKQMGLNQTGTASVALQNKLFSTSAPYYEPATATPAPAPDDYDDFDDYEEETTYVRLAQGSSGARVRNLQRRLKELGYYTGTVDGSFGSGTAGAVKRFQRAVGDNVTGVATAALQRKLYASNAPVYEGDEEEDTAQDEYILLSPGDSGSEVKRLQRRLKELGYFDGELGGNYLTKTTDAVKRFQQAIGANPTGIATAALQKRLFASNAPYYGDADQGDDEPEQQNYIKLQKGNKGSRVTKLQQRLKELGYFTTAITGTYGSKTIQAVKAFEARYGKEQTGVATIALQKELFSEDALAYAGSSSGGQDEDDSGSQTASYTKLQKGDSGAKVKQLQRRLKELGYFEGAIGGNYQKLTTDAVKLFQTAVGLKANGVATVATQERLYADDAPIYQPQATPTPNPYQALQRGDTGSAVELLQNRLIELGYIRSADEVKLGTFDKNTMLAVIDAQNERGYDSDGAADEEFLYYIYSEDVWDVVLAGYAGG